MFTYHLYHLCLPIIFTIYVYLHARSTIVHQNSRRKAPADSEHKLERKQSGEKRKVKYAAATEVVQLSTFLNDRSLPLPPGGKLRIGNVGMLLSSSKHSSRQAHNTTQ